MESTDKESTNITYEDYSPVFKDALKRDLKLPEGELTGALLEAAVYCVNQGFIEMEPFYNRYSEYLCKVCGKLHWSACCQELENDISMDSLF